MTPSGNSGPADSGPEEAARAALRAGAVVLLDTDSLPGLHALASIEGAADALRREKASSAVRPFLLLFASLDAVLECARPFRDEDLPRLESAWPGPLTVLLRPRPGLPPQWMQGSDRLAARVPASQELRDLIERLDAPLFSSSANREGQPPARTLEEARALFPGVEVFVLGEPSPGRPSTLVDLAGPRPHVLREGLAPWPPAGDTAKEA